MREAWVFAWLKQRAGAWFAGVFAFCFACAQVSYSIVMRDPSDQKWLWLAALVTLALGAMAWRLIEEREIHLDSLDAMLAAFLFYAALSLAWTPDRASGQMFLVKVAAAAAIFIYMKDVGGEALFRRLAAWTTIAAAIALALSYTQPDIWGGFHNQNFITEYLLLALPFCFGYAALAASRIRRAGAAVTILATLWYLVADNPSRIEFVIIPLALAGAAALVCGRRWGWRPVLAIAVAAAIGLILMAVAFWDAFPYTNKGLRLSFLPRIALVVDTFTMWLDAPILGHGAGSFQYLFPAYQEDHSRKFNIDIPLLPEKHVIAGAAHNEYLELLAGVGLLGAAIVAAFIWRLVRIVRAGPAFGPMQYAALGAIVVWTLNAALEFPLQNPATLLLALTSVAILAANSYRARSDTLRLRIGGRAAGLLAAAAIALAVGVQVLCDRLIDASKYHRAAIFLMSAQDPRGSYLALREAYLRNPWDYHTRATMFLGAVILMDRESWSAPTFGERIRRQPFLSGQMDSLYDIAVSAGMQSGVLNSRLYYLVRSGNYSTHRAETDASLAFLRRNAAIMSDTWKMDAVYGALHGNQRQVTAAREAAEKNRIPKAQVDQIRWLEQATQVALGGVAKEQKVMRLERELPAAAQGLARRFDP